MVPLSSILLEIDEDSLGIRNNKKMIKDFLIIDCTGRDDSIILKINNMYFTKKLQTNLIKNEILALEIANFTKKHKVKLNSDFSVFINSGPGSFSGIRISLSVIKGLKIVKNINIYSYNNFLLNAAPYLDLKKKIISIQKTNNFYYYCKGVFETNYYFSTPKKIDSKTIQKKDALFIVPNEIKSDEIIKKIDPKQIRIVEFNVKNIDFLIKNGLLENKLIKPLYLS